MENIDVILYINLAHREDRKEHILKEIKKVCNDESKIHRIDAIKMSENGAMGCTMSHIKTLEYILDHPEWNNCLILEDDFTFRSTDINDKLHIFFKNFSDYDMCILAHDPNRIIYNNTNIDFIKRASYSVTASGYIVNKKFVKELVTNYKDGLIHIIKYGMHVFNCLDEYWNIILQKSKWYSFYPALGYQIISYSDIAKCITTHTY